MISFDGNNLESAVVLINKLNRFDGAVRDLQVEFMSFQDGFYIPSDYWRSRTIKLSGMINSASASDMATQVDSLKQYLSGVNKNLDIDYGSGTRRFKATLKDLQAPEEFYNITHLPYQAEFICQPFGYATSNTTFSSSDITTASHSGSHDVVGTYKPQPIITITFDSATSVTALTFTNTTTGDAITVTTALAASDVLVINTETHKVTKNGSQIDFTGPIPEFSTGTNEYTIAVTSTSHQYDLSISYLPRYL